MADKTTTDHQARKYKQRRMRLWRAKFGVDLDVCFAKEYPPRMPCHSYRSGKSFMALSTALVFDYSDTEAWLRLLREQVRFSVSDQAALIERGPSRLCCTIQPIFTSCASMASRYDPSCFS